ncbi:hypothetical protein M8A51_05250 [Schlegelella sp. S2-27]|uniref:DUF3563 domain-containing protein n=1 Tax=Caldimonas mangrovi TaxID=2944811 RepID=A0ABT0YKP2_9BURK|nr:hypothetical protein [Caldimonas mangrovi]MCM5678934.1 hypothetical protein [Caldimonas mangrovi]
MTSRSAHLPRHAATPVRMPFAAAIVQGLVQALVHTTHGIAGAWRRLAEDQDARFLRSACDLEDLEYRLRVLERGRRGPGRAMMARGPYA